MSKGIALQFRNKFNNVHKLIDQEKKTTEIAYLKNGSQWILYLITKNKYYDKPAYTNIFNTLTNTRQFCIENNITTLALPKICTGQDKKDWNVISTMIKFIFQNTQIKILICLLPSNDNENKYYKNNDSQTTNITIGKNFNNTISDNLKNEIALIDGSFRKTKDVPGDGDCGAHALRICLKQHGIYRKTVELLNMLGIPNCKSGYYFKNDDLAFICDQFNLNLYLIHEDSEYTNAIIYWKSNRKIIGIFEKDNNWTPGIITKINKQRQFNNIIINTVFPDFNTVEKNVDHFLYECFDRLKLSQQNTIEKNKTGNYFKTDKSTIWYSQFCQDCEYLSTTTTKDVLDDHDDKEEYWSEGGNVMFCEICGNYIREYRNRPIQEDEKAIETKNQLIQNKDEIKIKNQNTSVDSDTDRKQRVLSIQIKLDGNEQNAIIDTGSNLSCIDYSLVKNKQEMKPENKHQQRRHKKVTENIDKNPGGLRESYKCYQVH
ncbi:unnamed protein product [Macrosiphum euphorbiae]|uniref:Macro domain-containing protein n=1 Tax=Macrosiphum euphorbiae TaxID=13131 RepID=A0AAV0W7D7_9HEMI|nr:unnamed protein product [Macrosiphum euphorbiae]